MKRKVLISLVSAQTIPNVLLIKSLPQQDLYYFISTPKMEKQGRTEWIIQSCNIPSSKKSVIEVIEDNLIDITDKLSKLALSINDDILVNLTGGTKIMTLATYNFLRSNYPQATFYYKSITQFEYFNIDVAERKMQIDYQPSVGEYLKAYGINFKEKQPVNEAGYSEFIFQKFINNDIDRAVLTSLRKHYRNKKKSISIDDVINFTEETESDEGKRISNLNEFLSAICYPLKEEGKLTPKDVEYLTGGWFEEYIYYKLKGMYSKADIRLGINLIKGNQSNDNDLDVVVCYQDQLYVIECKTSLKHEGKYTQLFNETVYKAAAINKNFGLSVNSCLFTLDNFENKFFDFKQKAKVLNIELADVTDIKDGTALVQMIKTYAPQPL